MNYLLGLNEPQKEAVLTTEGPVLIIAGAGAGKTKTLTTRIVHLICKGVSPEAILAITFTNKAAKEMRDRVTKILQDENLFLPTVPTISTFHALGVAILRQWHKEVGLLKSFSILDDGDTLSLIKECIRERGFDPKIIEPRKTKSTISRMRNDGLKPEELLRDARYEGEKMVAQVWAEYDREKKKQKVVDFDDLLILPVALLSEHEEARMYYKNRYQYVLVDEYQDTNDIQYTLIKQLLNEAHNICVVGDADQTIYGWRGANISHILDFERDFADVKTVFLEENYRSTQNILAAANAVIEKNSKRKEKNLFTKNKSGESIMLIECSDGESEAEYVTDEIVRLCDDGAAYSDIAILFRTNAQSRLFEESFIKRTVPYTMLGVKFYERREIKDVLSFIRAAVNRENLVDIKRVINLPPRGLGKVTLTKFFSGQQADLPMKAQKAIFDFYYLLDKIVEFSATHLPSETILYVIAESGLEMLLKNGTAEDLEDLQNMYELANLATRYDHLGAEGLEKMIEDATLMSDQDNLIGMTEEKESEDRRGRVRLMTVHAAKGLEFPYVFIVGMEEDLFPLRREGSIPTKDEKEEERRLFYVALTRAEERVSVSWANRRALYGSYSFRSPSNFIGDIPKDIVKCESLAERNIENSSEKIIWFDI
jgi:DNA helicase II / ATP-dependent DNA helicase PcrA